MDSTECILISLVYADDSAAVADALDHDSGTVAVRVGPQWHEGDKLCMSMCMLPAACPLVLGARTPHAMPGNMKHAGALGRCAAPQERLGGEPSAGHSAAGRWGGAGTVAGS